MILRSRRVVLPDGVRPASIEIHDGRIAAVTSDLAPRAPAGGVVDVGDLVVLPGLVDTHVHVNEPGRTDWEGFATATRAAAAGGVTTIVDMPLNSVPATTTVAALEAKRRAAAGRCHVNVACWGGVVPGNTSHLAPLAHAGVRGFKCFLSPSGVDEFEHVGEADLREAMPVLATLQRPLLVHAEWPPALAVPRGDPRRYATWLDSRPPDAELQAIERLVALAAEYGTRVHIVHLATGAALPMLAAARARGVPITVETCPHYLTFAAEDIADGQTAFKCAPPIRAAAERQRLWQGLTSGVIDLVATDHSPAPPALKHLEDGDFVAAWGGIASLQLALAAVWTGARQRGVSMESLARWLAEAPARLAGLYPRKGVITPGADADLVVWEPEAATVVDAAALYHRHPVTPYHGHPLRGRVHQTLVAGEVVFGPGAREHMAVGRWL